MNNRTLGDRLYIVAVGGKGQVFMKDVNNCTYMTNDLNGVIHESTKRQARFVALGPTTTSYFVILMSGVMIWRDVPGELDSILRRSQDFKFPRVEFVGLGRKGQYFVRFAGGEWRVGGCCHADEKFLRNTVGEVREVYFVSDGGVVKRFNPVKKRFCVKRILWIQILTCSKSC